MSWTPIVRRFFTIEQLPSYIALLPPLPWVKMIAWHNTQAPTLQQWIDSAKKDAEKKRTPGATRIGNLESYFQSRGWSSGPHWFVTDTGVWAFTPMTHKGTHSPSWNGTGIGIEMVADFAVEDDDVGVGLKVKNNTTALTAMICDKTGVMPAEGLLPMDLVHPSLARGIRLHKEDPATTHDCPGKNIAVDKASMIQATIEYMGHAGEHVKQPEELPTYWTGTVNTPNDTLSLRDKASASGKLLASLADRSMLAIFNRAKNGTTEWLYVQTTYSTKGWVAARFVKENENAP